MIGGVAGQLQSKISFYGCTDVRGAGGEDAPAAVFVLVLEDIVRGFVKTLGIAGAEQRMQQDVIGFESGIGLELAAPVAVFVLLGEKLFAGRFERQTDAAGEAFNLAETKLWFRG